MAEELWNKVNIPFPSAASSVRVTFAHIKVSSIHRLVKKNDEVLQLLGSDILQTEIRVLYELLFVCKNNHGTNLTFRTLKQVEQCINRLKEMKLDAALRDLAKHCSTRFLFGLCEVPSQPMLEWICLKVLGAARLMTCVMDYCSRSFIRARQQLKQDEFVVLNVIIAGMVSRLWVYFRAIGRELVPLYGHIQDLLTNVSSIHPRPFITGCPLPINLMEFLGQSWSSLLPKGLNSAGSCADQNQQTLAPSNSTVEHSEDVGVAVQRVQDVDCDLNPSVKIFKTFRPEPIQSSSSLKRQRGEQEKVFHAQVRTAATLRNLATHLTDIIEWCGSRKQKWKRYFSHLHLKCERFERLGLTGRSLRRKLLYLKREACLILSKPLACGSLSTQWRKTHPKTRFQLLRSGVRAAGARVKVQKKPQPVIRRKSKQPKTHGSQTSTCSRPEGSASGGPDEIDDIFSVLGF